jgi:predicted membrane chloride channel (bestrophin family)
VVLAAVVAFIFSSALGDVAATTHIDKLSEIGRFLNAFVGLLLGFFLSASVNRFWSCADGFLGLFDAIRNLHMQLSALGVAREKIDNCSRFGVISAWVLQKQLKMEAKGSRQNQEGSLWDEFESGDMDEAFGKLAPSELELLRDIHDPASLLWTWAASFVARLAQDGEIPPMQSPTYGRVMQHVVDAHRSIRQVRSSLSIQAPYIYVHLLASLVHINNLVNAIGFGIAWGSAMAEAHKILHHGGQSQKEEAIHDAEQLWLSFFYSCLGPLIYQAMLEVGIVIAEPFRSEDAQIPITRLLQGLEKDLHDGNRMAASTPWQRPSFQAAGK